MTTEHSVKSGVDALALTSIGLAIAAAAATLIQAGAGLTRFALGLAAG
jgi:DMSO/TMAO reductase YedYZ heme-binding membrane subunit